MIEWNYSVVALCLLLLLFLTWKEWRRKNKSRLVGRIAATLLAVVSLACLALPISYRRIDKVTSSNEAILLTEGYNEDSLDNFLSGRNKNIPLFITNENLQTSRKYAPSVVNDPAFFAGNNHQPGVVHVFGYGLERGDLDRLDSTPVIFHSSEPGTGISSAYWDKKLKTGDRLLVQGTINNLPAKQVRIILSGFGATLDSIQPGAGKNVPFELATVPKHEGRNIYTLTVLNGRDTIENQRLPVEVETGETLKILMLASSPDFEDRFLKNFCRSMAMR